MQGFKKIDHFLFQRAFIFFIGRLLSPALMVAVLGVALIPAGKANSQTLTINSVTPACPTPGGSVQISFTWTGNPNDGTQVDFAVGFGTTNVLNCTNVVWASGTACNGGDNGVTPLIDSGDTNPADTYTTTVTVPAGAPTNFLFVGLTGNCGTVFFASGANANCPTESDIWATFTLCNAPTPTSTPTGGATSTFTSTATATFTATPTATPTFTAIATTTFTATTIATMTFTSTSTSTYTVTATNTNIPTSTFTQTITQTPIFTATITQTPTMTQTPAPTLPDIFYVSQNLFRPANGPVSIYISYPNFPGNLNLMVYNTAGEHIRTLLNTAVSQPITLSCLWDGKNKYGNTCASGVYIFYLVEPFDTKLRKVVLVR